MAQINMSKTIFQPAFSGWLCLLLFRFDFTNTSKELRIKKKCEFLKSDIKDLLNILGLSVKLWNILRLIITVAHFSGRLREDGCKTSPVPRTYALGWCCRGFSLLICAAHPPAISTQKLTCFCPTGSYTSVGAELSHSPKLWPWVYKAF